MAIVKPWEETWEWSGVGHVVCGGDEFLRTTARPMLDDEISEARAKLAAAAPELVRVLLDVEWAGRSQYGEPRCPSCNGEPSRDDKPWRPSHASDCTLDAALRKAGVR